MNSIIRCQPGDRAMVIFDQPKCTSNIGRIVQVEGPVSLKGGLNLKCWLIRPIGTEPWAVGRDGVHVLEQVDWGSGIVHPDQWLLPLRPENTLIKQTVDKSAGRRVLPAQPTSAFDSVSRQAHFLSLVMNMLLP